RHELEKIPLRHERDELELRRQPIEGETERLTGGRLKLNRRHLAVGQCQERVGESELVEQPERRWVNGVAAEGAKKVVMFFEHDDVDTRSCEEETEDGAGWTTTGNRARRRCGRHEEASSRP